jgi:hypothetical protein
VKAGGKNSSYSVSNCKFLLIISTLAYWALGLFIYILAVAISFLRIRSHFSNLIAIKETLRKKQAKKNSKLEAYPFLCNEIPVCNKTLHLT